MRNFLFFITVFFTSIISTSAQVSWTKGDGSQNNPYQIETVAHLQYLAQRVNSGITYQDTYFKLMNDLDLSTVCGKNIGDSGVSWLPIGMYYNTFFQGLFNGNNKYINNIYIDKPNGQYISLFGNIKNASILSLHIGSGLIVGNYHVAGICAYATNSHIDNCSNNAIIKGYHFVGGISSYCSSSEIKNCINSGNIYTTGIYPGGGEFGGICGQAHNTLIYNCVNTATVSGVAILAGICSSMYLSSAIKYCINSGNVVGINNIIGGIIGIASDRTYVQSCINVGYVKGGTDNIGGICGKNDVKNTKAFVSCYFDKQMCTLKKAIGNNENMLMDAGKFTHQLIGTQMQIDTSFSNAHWFFEGGMYPRPLGLQFFDNIIVLATPIFLDTTNTVDSITNHFKINIRNNVTWKNSNKIECQYKQGEFKILSAPVKDTLFAYLNAIKYKEIDLNINSLPLFGTEDNPLMIESVAELISFRDTINAGKGSFKGTNIRDGGKGKYFVIINNLDLLNICGTKNGDTTSWIAIGTKNNPFKGFINGKNSTISNLYINKLNEDYQGLFGCLGKGAIIDSIHLLNNYVQGKDFVGALCGYADSSSISNCSASGYVRGNDYVGGVIGFVTLPVSNCVNASVVRGMVYVGGICGEAVSVSHCINSGDIVAINRVGGISGHANIQRCMNSGNIQGVSYVGGICGLTDSLSECINIARVNASENFGLICGFVSIGAKKYIKTAYYDKQLCDKIPAVGNDFSFLKEAGKLTAELTGLNPSGLHDFNFQNWEFKVDHYPCPKNIENNDISEVATSPIFLDINNTIDSITLNFNVQADNNVAWKNSNNNAMKYSNGRFYILSAPNSDVLYASKNGILYKTIHVNIKTTPDLGAEDNPLTIDNLTEFLQFRDTINAGKGSYKGVDISNGGLNKSFILTCDLDLKTTCGIQGLDTISWLPIGNETNPFKGTFKGSNHRIENLYIHKPNFDFTPSKQAPEVYFISHYDDTIYYSGPFTINAKVATRSSSPINTPVLHFVTYSNSQTIHDSVVMSSLYGDSLWIGTIPPLDFNTNLYYYIIASDKAGNINRAQDKLYIAKYKTTDSNSVAMVSIEKPDSLVVFKSNCPMYVTIQNTGIENLKSAIIGWSINHIAQSPFLWSGNLSSGMDEKINLGKYISGDVNTTDTLMFWVSSPNGFIDYNSKDDTLTAFVKNTCSGILSGVYIIGNSDEANYKTINQALSALKNSICIDKNIVLKLENGTYVENIDLTNLADEFQNYSLTITSLTNQKDSVILSVSSGVLITLNNTNNLYLQKITLNVSNAGTYAILFLGQANNISIRNCNIYANPTAQSNSYAGIYCDDSHSWILNNISIFNNVIDGGFSNIHLWIGSEQTYGTGITVDCNTCTNAYWVGINISRAKISSVSNNIIVSRTTNSTEDIYAMHLKYVEIKEILGNKINVRCLSNRLYTIYLNSAKFNKITPFVFANNEIRVISNGSSAYVLYLEDAKGEFYHNSIYLTSGGSGGGCCFSTINSTANLKNNNFVCSSNQTIFNGNPTSSDYNNYYGGNFNLITWQSTTGQDAHSISQLPPFLNVNINLELSEYSAFTCPRLPNVLIDINGVSRTPTTTMGAYSRPFYEKSNETIITITPLKQLNENDLEETENADIQIDIPVEKSLLYVNEFFSSISRDSIYYGLFGYIEKAKIDSLHLINSYIKGVYFIGSIAGFADSSILSFCTNSGSLCGDYYIGGIIGRAKQSKVNQCVNTSIVKGMAAMGGICGDAREHANITNCLNSGLLMGTSANIGGITGILDSSSLTYSVNTALIKGSSFAGAIVGKANQSILTNCIYDNQLSVKKAIGSDYDSYGMDRESDFVFGKPTEKMLNDSLSDYINPTGTQYWIFANNIYPRPLGVANSDVALVASLPVFLLNDENADSVFTDFKLGKGNDVIQSAWCTNDTSRLKILDTIAKIPCFMRNDTVSISTSYNEATKYVLVKVTNPIEIPEKPIQIYGTYRITKAGKYTYFIHTVTGATAYKWYVSDTNCIVKCSKDTIVLSINENDTVFLSVKAINECGESELQKIKIISTIEPVIPTNFRLVLGQNYPNPAKTFTKIPFSIPRDGNVKFQITDVYGQIIYQKELTLKKGEHIIDFDTQNLENAIYFYSIEYNKTKLSKKMCVQK